MTLSAVWFGYRFCRSIICLLGRLHWFNSVVLSRVWRWSLNPPWDPFFFHASRPPTAALVENPPKRCRAYSTELLRMDLLVCSHEIPNPISIRYLHSTYSDVSKVFRSLLFRADSSTHLEATSVAVPSVVHHMLLCGITAPTDCHAPVAFLVPVIYLIQIADDLTHGFIHMCAYHAYRSSASFYTHWSSTNERNGEGKMRSCVGKTPPRHSATRRFFPMVAETVTSKQSTHISNSSGGR